MKAIIYGGVVTKIYKDPNGWVEETKVVINEKNTFDDFIKKFQGKKVKITIEEIK